MSEKEIASSSLSSNRYSVTDSGIRVCSDSSSDEYADAIGFLFPGKIHKRTREERGGGVVGREF